MVAFLGTVHQVTAMQPSDHLLWMTKVNPQKIEDNIKRIDINNGQFGAEG
jgi:hypothetical protein